MASTCQSSDRSKHDNLIYKPSEAIDKGRSLSRPRYYTRCLATRNYNC